MAAHDQASASSGEAAIAVQWRQHCALLSEHALASVKAVQDHVMLFQVTLVAEGLKEHELPPEIIKHIVSFLPSLLAVAAYDENEMSDARPKSGLDVLRHASRNFYANLYWSSQLIPKVLAMAAMGGKCLILNMGELTTWMNALHLQFACRDLMQDLEKLAASGRQVGLTPEIPRMRSCALVLFIG
jgi:hypothetical protein